MSIKSEIQTRVNTIETGVLNPAETVRNVFSTEDNSILENIYMTPAVDVSDGTKVVTTSNSNFSYIATFVKTGRTINVKGSFTNISGVTISNDLVFEITNSEYQSFDERARNMAYKNDSSVDVLRMYFDSGSDFKFAGTILHNETFNFNFNYNAEN